MILFVHGFPCKVAALQFEHAWQHGYKTHYIPEDVRIVKNKNGGRSVHHKLGILKLLLKNIYFRHMNLKVEIFNAETERLWLQDKFESQGSNYITFTTAEGALGVPDISSAKAIEAFGCNNLELVRNFFEDQCERDRLKSIKYGEKLTNGEIPCGICEQTFDYTSEEETMKPFVGFCYSDKCSFVAHLSCLHRYFSDDEQLLSGKEVLIPMGGKCPSCTEYISWTSIVKYATIMKALYGS